jgi:hypothetical protein
MLYEIHSIFVRRVGCENNTPIASMRYETLWTDINKTGIHPTTFNLYFPTTYLIEMHLVKYQVKHAGRCINYDFQITRVLHIFNADNS